MRRLVPILLSATILGAAPARAAEIDVQDLGGMTRLVIPMPPGTGWSVESVTRGVNLAATSSDHGIYAPSLPAQGRLAQLDVWQSETESGVEIRFGCDCTINHYPGSNAIIIDVTDRPVRMEPASTVTETSGNWATSSVTRSTAPVPNPARAATAESEEVWRLATVLVGTPMPRPRPQRREVKVARSDDAGIDALRDSVLGSLALAAEQGRITMDTGPERGRNDYIPAGCPDEDALDLKRLTTPGDFRTPLPKLRAAVFDDLKQVDPAAVRALARHFLAYGLGEEANAALDAFDMDEPGAKIIRTMATILEGRAAELENVLLLKEGCGPRAAVWRTAVEAEAGSGKVREGYADAASALYDVPDPLRKILGARIALGLLGEDDRESAMRIWRNLETARGPETPEMRLLAARVSANPLARLVNLSETRSPVAVEAALHAAGSLLDHEDRALAERLGVTLEDLAFIHGNTPRESELNLALARIQARYGDLASALSLLNEKAGTHPEKAEGLRDIAYQTIQSASDAADPVARPTDFGTILAALQYLDESETSDAMRLSLAQKLMDAGGAHIIGEVLPSQMLKRSVPARRLLAEAKLRRGDATGARKLLRSLKDDDSEALREKAREMAGIPARKNAQARFGPVLNAPETNSLAAARALMEETETDLSIVEELLTDG